MSNLAHEIHEEPSQLDHAFVVAAQPGTLAVERAGRRFAVLRAASCLVEPRVGDEVLVASTGDRCFVLAVLVRADTKKATRIALDGDVELALPRGRLQVTTQKGMDVTTAGEASISAPRIRVRAVEGDVVMQKLHMVGSLVQAELTKLSVAADTVETFAERLWQRVKRSYRFVDETDQLRAGNIDQRAREVLRQHANNTVITANHLAKVDAEQIHIG